MLIVSISYDNKSKICLWPHSPHGAVNINTVVEMLTTQIAVEVNPVETNFQPVKSVCMQITQITLEINPTKINNQ